MSVRAVTFLLLATLTGCLANCLYDRSQHVVGSTWRAVDRCNTCTCHTTGMHCTTKTCKASGFAQPGVWGDCNYEGAWYRLHDQWQTTDGCNTCVCAMPGNYRGYQVCTGNTCNNPSISVG